jgi:hypothetical protein
MALHYQTEYRLGRRYGRVCRSYTGFRAFLAIVLDLTFGMVFELVCGVITFALRLAALAIQLVAQVLKFNWRILLVAMTMVVYVVTAPFALLHRVVERVRWERPYQQPRSESGPVLKPDWGLGQEI